MKSWLTAATLALSLTLAHAADDAAKAAEQAQKADATAQASGFKIRPVDDAWRAALPRNAEAATQAYLDRLPADVVAKSDAYYTGGYWLILWELLASVFVAVVLMTGRRAARLRDACQRVGRGPVRRDALFGAAYVLASALLTLPLAIYSGWWREQAYDMSTQTFVAWLGETALSQLIDMVMMGIVVAGLYIVIRRAGARWWIWGTGGGIVALIVVIAISPVLIQPLFNTYKPVEDGPVKAAVLQMAHANGVPVDNVYVFDASRQTTRVSANVSGMLGSAAVRLNDNLLRRTSEPEIRAVMGHELGHYVMNHMVKNIAMITPLVFIGFAVVAWAMQRLHTRFAATTGVSRIDDVAGLPMLVAVLSIFFTLATPLLHTMTRVQEAEADKFSLNLTREPHGFAEAQLKLVEYRKASPGPIEEFVFFHHPSTRNRIYDAMRWREAMGTP
ncbi:M48 family metallopeptidase [Roseateles sp. DXS20W]|uniref:M48 family metallopeptidase n=1 Tax=Pelomonas lactea TaxID=3299030 RepID=A0ABW7GS09_9BURK